MPSPTVQWSPQVSLRVLRFLDKLRRKARQRRSRMHAPLHPLAPIRLRRALPPPQQKAAAHISDDSDSDVGEDVREEDSRKAGYRVRPHKDDPHAHVEISSDSSGDQQGPGVGSTGRQEGVRGRLAGFAHLPPLPAHAVPLQVAAAELRFVDPTTQFADEHFHFTAQPHSARRTDISDDSDDDRTHTDLLTLPTASRSPRAVPPGPRLRPAGSEGGHQRRLG